MDKLPSLVQSNLQAFESLIPLLELEDAVRAATVQSHLARFKLWAGSLGAHRTSGTRSLIYRLRDASTIRSHVVSLLENLQGSLNEAISLIQSPRCMAGGEQFNDDVDNELAHLLGETENSSGDRPDYGTGLARFLVRMGDVVDCLLRLSVTIRDPAPYDQFKSRVDTSQYEPHDINHVREKFPKLDPRVIMRLGKASTQRRGYFKYREDHHRRLQEGLRPDGDVHQGSEGGGTTVASPIPQHLSDSTQLNYAMPDTASSETSATSYARSINLDASEIHLPPLPKEHADGPFLCPFCFMIISADTRHEWKYHVFRDLRPYVCIWNDCVSTGQDFQKRKDWISHMTREHWRQWDCPFGCSTPLDDSRALESHLKGIHAEKLDTRRATEILVRISRIDAGKANGDCPLCWNFEVKSIRQYASHVGHHLEQLALFALPNLDECEEEDREDRAS
ncbi:hypothetical protein F5883DRAFT_502279, partial [Diaporthe sp. PMI_573]